MICPNDAAGEGGRSEDGQRAALHPGRVRQDAGQDGYAPFSNRSCCGAVLSLCRFWVWIHVVAQDHLLGSVLSKRMCSPHGKSGSDRLSVHCRHARGHPGHLQDDAARQASDDVQCDAQQGDPAGLQEVHERRECPWPAPYRAPADASGGVTFPGAVRSPYASPLHVRPCLEAEQPPCQPPSSSRVALPPSRGAAAGSLRIPARRSLASEDQPSGSQCAVQHESISAGRH